MADNESSNRKECSSGPAVARGMSMGAGIGVALGAGFGVVLGNIAVGVGAGVASGAAIGMTLAMSKKGQFHPLTPRSSGPRPAGAAAPIR